MPTPVAFEAALAEIEQIVAALERGGPDLQGALAGYGRGITLLTACQQILDDAERSVTLLTGVDESGTPLTSPFDATATAAATPAPAPVPIPTVAAQVVPAPPPPRKAKAAPVADPPAAPPAPSSIPEAPF